MRDTVSPYEVLTVEQCASAPSLDWAYTSAMRLLQQPVDAAISSILEDLGRASAADRAWMFEYDADLLRFHNTHEWSRRGIASFVEDLQGTPVTMIAWLHQYLVAGKAVLINDVDALPRPARALQVELQRQSNKSVLSVPVFHDGNLRACIGFDAVKAPRRWSQSEVKAHFQCADMIGSARYGAVWRGSRAARSSQELSSLIYLRPRGGVRGVEATAIVGLRSARNYTEVWLSDGSMVFDLRSLGIWSGLLSKSSFLRVHRTAIVNLSHVRQVNQRNIDKWDLTLRNLERAWPISRTCRKELRTRLGI